MNKLLSISLFTGMGVGMLAGSNPAMADVYYRMKPVEVNPVYDNAIISGTSWAGVIHFGSRAIERPVELEDTAKALLAYEIGFAAGYIASKISI